MMEEEIQMLFRLAMPEDWRNRMPSTPPPSPVVMEEDGGIAVEEGLSLEGNKPVRNFWRDVGLRSYAQMDFDLELSLDHHSHQGRGKSTSCKKRGKGHRSKGNKVVKVVPGEEEVGVEKVLEGEAVGISEDQLITPPNALCLINVLRLTIDCPFRDIRKQAGSVLQMLMEKGVAIPYSLIWGPTTFIHPAECPSIDVEKYASELGLAETVDLREFMEDPTFADAEYELAEQLAFQKARLLSEAFLSSGRVDHTIQLMAYHPDYLEIFLRTHHFLMRGDGPLPYNFRNYIAIMAAARYRCSYLMEHQKREFLYQGGDPNWLLGLTHAPPKLVALYTINKIMAHRPWVLKKEDLLHLTKKCGWSLSELVQAIVLLAHFHALSSFIHGCGITPEVDFDNGHTFLVDSPLNPTTNQIPPVVPPSTNQTSTSPQVSFAIGPPAISTTTNTLASSGAPLCSPKQTKSILKKTDKLTGTSPPNSSHSSSSASSTSSTGGGGGAAALPETGSLSAISTNINVPSMPPPSSSTPSVHFHPYHHPRSSHHGHSHHSPSPSFTGSPILKSDTLHNSSLLSSFGSSPPPLPSTMPTSSTISEVDIIMATMKNLSETSPIEDPEERKKRFETVARSDLESCDAQKENLGGAMALASSLPTGVGLSSVDKPLGQMQISKQGSCGAGAPIHKSMLPPDVSPFIMEAEFTYEDFAKRGQLSELHTFRIQDYSWEEHGYSLVNRLYAEVGQILDDKFKVAQNMTYYTIGGRANVDTTKFRTAVWNYIQCLYGIRHDDYDYGEVNQLLERPLKAFIKTVCCYPERITKADYDNVMREFRHSEKVHVNLMIMEAKLQAELLYGLRTVMKLMF